LISRPRLHMRDDWQESSIADLIAQGVLYIGDGYRAKLEELGSSGLPFARAGNIDGGFQFEGADRFPGDNLSRVGNKVSQPGDVVFTSKGTVGRFALVRDKTPQFVYSPQLCFWRALRPDYIHPRFLFYWMSGREFYVQYKGVAAQTDMAEYVSLADQRRMRITLPGIEEQRAIAHILGTLDDKIDLNRRMNETLEAMARAIFKSWFVDFDPVRSKAEGRHPHGMNAETAALFPNSFQDSSLGKIPKGWKVARLGEIAENPRRGVHPKAAPDETPYIGLEHMPRKSIALATWGHSGEVASNKFRFPQGEILFGKLRPYFHKVGVAVESGVCSTDILVISPKSEQWYGLVLGHVSSEEFVAHTDAVCTGTKMPRTNWQDMARYEIALPDSRLAVAFTSFAKTLVEAIRQNILQSHTLEAIRDALIPKLMSGEIRLTHPKKLPGAKP
jgi:type I restriction enzyme, S subunit